MSLLQCTSRAVCTERIKHQPSCLCWNEFTAVYQPSCLHWKDKAPAELFVLTWVYCSVPAELFALKGYSTSRAVCAEMSLLQCTSRAVCTERIKHQPSCLCWNEFTAVYQPSCLHWKDKAPAVLFVLKWVYYRVLYLPYFVCAYAYLANNLSYSLSASRMLESCMCE
jgi:hypothetical protein